MEIASKLISLLMITLISACSSTPKPTLSYERIMSSGCMANSKQVCKQRLNDNMRIEYRFAKLDGGEYLLEGEVFWKVAKGDSTIMHLYTEFKRLSIVFALAGKTAPLKNQTVHINGRMIPSIKFSKVFRSKETLARGTVLTFSGEIHEGLY